MTRSLAPPQSRVLISLIITLSVVLCAVLVSIHRLDTFSVPGHHSPEYDMPTRYHVDEISRKVDTDKMLKDTTLRKRQLEQEQEQVEQPSDEEEEEKPPMNILLFYADDWRYDTMGAAGNPIVKTPFIDALAKEGVRFTENCVTTSICWISRATLYTGQYLARHHFEMLGRGRTIMQNGKPIEMKLEVPANETIYSLMKNQANYFVGHAGKLGLWIDHTRYLGKGTFDYFVDEDGWHYREMNGKMVHITNKNTGDALRF